jgi:hypothetical protein
MAARADKAAGLERALHVEPLESLAPAVRRE